MVESFVESSTFASELSEVERLGILVEETNNSEIFQLTQFVQHRLGLRRGSGRDFKLLPHLQRRFPLL